MAVIKRLLAPLLLCAFVVGAFAPPARAQSAADRLEVVLAIDTSGSMWPALDATKVAANEFVDAMPVEVQIGVATFGDDVAVLTPPIADRALVRAQIGALAAGGDTALYDAVVAASTMFTPGAEQRVLVILSDGADDGSDATLDQAIVAVEGVHVESISLATESTDLATLAALGPVTAADDPAGLSAAFARAADLVAEVVVPTTPPTTTLPPTTTSSPATTVPPTTTTVAPTTTMAPTTTVAPTTTLAPTTTIAPTTTVYARPPAPTAGTGSGATGPSPMLWLGAGAIFAGLLGLGLLLFPRQRVSKARLGVQQPRSVSDVGTRTISAVEAALERHGKRSELATTLSVAGISTQPGEFVGIVGIVAAVAGLVGLMIFGPVAAVLVATVICLGVSFYVGHNKTKRQAAFADQLPDVLQLVTTALRSGYGLPQALESVAEEAEEPARSEFAHVLVESRLGRDLSDAMRALAHRMGSADLEWVVSAIDINRDTGGNLSEILNTVGDTIRERQRMARHIRTLTAEGRLSARILTAVPVGIALWQWWINPESFVLLLHGAGLIALAIAVVLLLLGAVWVRKLVNSIAL